MDKDLFLHIGRNITITSLSIKATLNRTDRADKTKTFWYRLIFFPWIEDHFGTMDMEINGIAIARHVYITNIYENDGISHNRNAIFLQAVVAPISSRSQKTFTNNSLVDGLPLVDDLPYVRDPSVVQAFLREVYNNI